MSVMGDIAANRRPRATSSYFLTGAEAIARELGCSAVTVRRMAKSGRLKVFRTGAGSSPIKAWVSEIARIRGGR